MIVVTGATGNVGRPLVEALAGGAVTAVSRGAADLPEGVRHHRADLTDAASLGPALAGAGALFLHDGGASASRLRPVEILAAAREAGVGRVVLLSSIGVRTRPESLSHGRTLRAIDDAVRASGLDWTILRSSGLASNAYAWAASVREARVAAAPYGDVGLPLVDPADVAAVAAAALREDGHAGRVYELTGPELSTPRRRAAEIAAAIGEPVRFVEQARDEARAEMVRFMPEAVADTTLDVLGTPTAGELRISPDVERVIGRPAAPFAGWARRNAPAFT